MLSIISLILALLAAAGVSIAIQEIRERRKNKSRLKERLGADYDNYVEMRKGKK